MSHSFPTRRSADLAAVLEDVHLLLHDVGLVADCAEEDAGILHDGGGDLAVVEEARHALGGVADVPPEGGVLREGVVHTRSEEHTSELQSLMRISYAVCCLKKKT